MKFKPYVSIDLEFTSLKHEDSQILEIGAVYDDGVSDIDELPTFKSIIYYSEFQKASLEALVINAKLLKEIKDIPAEHRLQFAPSQVLSSFYHWLDQLRNYNPETDKCERLVVAGKNAAGADIPILKRNCLINNTPDITNLFTHRTLDVGSMFAAHFGENVTLGKINELTGRAATVSHRALDDAMDVVYGIRLQYQMYQQMLELYNGKK
jgi:oligoribonuclease (3'-5' exoribonuclease)